MAHRLRAAALAVTAAGVAAAASLAPTARSAPAPPVRLVLPGGALHAGRQLELTLQNGTASTVEYGLCATLARQVGGHWVAVTRTHGVQVGCSGRTPANPITAPAHGHARLLAELYDDLAPGTYRVTVAYRAAASAQVIPAFTSSSARVATAPFHVLAFDPGPAPQLPESQLAAAALKLATAAGGSHPTLIQYGEGSHLLASLVGTGDLVYEWNWSYLIAMRGTFKADQSAPTLPGTTTPSTPTAPLTVLTLVIDAHTGKETDFGASRTYPDMSRMGTVTTVPAS